MASDKKQVDFQFRYQPQETTDDGVLLGYLKTHPYLDTKEAVMEPARSFWLPLAYQRDGSLDPSQLEQIGWGAVFALLRQVDYICTTLGLDRSKLGGWGLNPHPSTPVISFPVAAAANADSAAAVVKPKAAATVSSPIASPPNDDGIGQGEMKSSWLKGFREKTNLEDE